jgi:phenylacetate-CoA ligase
MYQFLYRHAILPAFETGLKRRKTFHYWKQLERTQWLPRAELERLQFQALRCLLNHAYKTCPYYREVWQQHGLQPDSLQAPADFCRWPIIDRETIRAHRSDMRSWERGLRLFSKSTGGSTGVPLAFDLNTDSNDRRVAAMHRGYSWAGAGPGTKQLYLWGVPLGSRSAWRRWKDRLYNILQRRLVLNSFDLTDEHVPVFLEHLNRYRPDAIVAYTNPLYLFARRLEERGLKPFSPRSIVVGAEKLYPFQRQLIERVFQAPVFETYGSREFMLIGGECDKHIGLHSTSEHLWVEVVDEKGRPALDGTEGDVVITDLYNYGMPFVRYATGDRAVAGWSTCSCERGLPLLRKIVGRRLDMLNTPDGRHVPGEFFPHLVKDFPAIRRFQVIQDAPDHVQLLLVISAAWNKDAHGLLERQVRDTLGSSVRLEMRVIDDIPLTTSGKHRVVVNLCDEVTRHLVDAGTSVLQ